MRLTTLLSFGTGLAAGYYLAAPIAQALAEDAPDASFEGMDLDGDGRVGAREHAAAARRMFATMDRNADGKVSAAEMEAAQPKVTGRARRRGGLSAAQKIRAVDGNGDRVLSAAEHAAASARLFADMDANRDGALSRREFERGHAGLKGGKTAR
jgi:Ca2+-binding EF-hand superfamily protein